MVCIYFRSIYRACQNLVEPDENTSIAVEVRRELDLRIGLYFLLMVWQTILQPVYQFLCERRVPIFIRWVYCVSVLWHHFILHLTKAFSIQIGYSKFLMMISPQVLPLQDFRPCDFREDFQMFCQTSSSATVCSLPSNRKQGKLMLGYKSELGYKARPNHHLCNIDIYCLYNICYNQTNLCKQLCCW